jgi:membrane protease YdiL (CAAX protease family)
MAEEKRSNRLPLAAFFLLAFALSWLVEVPLALSVRGVIDVRIPEFIHYAAGYGPLLAALAVTWFTEGRSGTRDWIGRIVRWKVPFRWWLAALSPLGVYLVVGAGLSLFRGAPLDLTALGQIEFAPDLGLAAVPLWILTFGIGEEAGWRGFALPRLQHQHSAAASALILGGFWGLWHLPLFFYTYDASLIPGFVFGLLAGSVVFTWLYNGTGGSALLCAVWHGMYNLTTACTSCTAGWAAPVISTLVMVWALLVVLLYKPSDFSTRKGTAPAARIPAP